MPAEGTNLGTSSTVQTVGVSPKVIVATIMVVVSYLVTQELVEFPAWADLILMCVLVAGGGFAASPGALTTVRKP